jgi:glycosyltransferase involved in cell wall biosynthesis
VRQTVGNTLLRTALWHDIVAHNIADDLDVTRMTVSEGLRLRSTMTEPRSILFVAASPKYGGTEKHLLDLVERLYDFKGRISILCTGEDVFSARLTAAQKASVQIETGLRLNSLREWVRLFHSHRPDVVVLVKSWTWCFPWYTLLAAWMAGIRRRYVLAHLPPGGSLSSKTGLLARWRYRLSHRRLGMFCTATLCVSDFIRKRLVEDCLFPAETTVVVHNGVSLSAFHPDHMNRLAIRQRLGIPIESTCLICIASLVEQKRIDVLLDAMVTVLRDRQTCRCLIVGEGPLASVLTRQAEMLGLAGHVFFEGFHNDILPYLQAGDVFVLTSDNEGLPLSVLEAMACGLPCIVTRVGGNAEAVVDGESGIIVPPGSPVDVAKAILTMIQQPRRRAAMGESARARVRQNFDVEACMAQIKTRILA